MPHPDGPMSETNSPWRMVRSTDSSAATALSPVPKTLPTPAASTTTGAATDPAPAIGSDVTAFPPLADSARG